MFAYCENNPVNAQDSDGHFGWIIAGFVIGGAIGGNAAISSATSIISDYVSGGKSIKQIRDSAIENGIIGGIVGAYGGRGAQYGRRIKSSIYTRAYSPINAD